MENMLKKLKFSKVKILLKLFNILEINLILVKMLKKDCLFKLKSRLNRNNWKISTITIRKELMDIDFQK